MAQLLVRNIDESIKIRLQHRAKRHGTSMEEEARNILRNALLQEETSPFGMGTEIVELFRGIGLDEQIPELRGHLVTPIIFEP